jgi:chaperonin GroES
MKLTPLHDNVLVRRHDKEETSAGGLILAASAVEKPRLGTVVAVGPGKTIKGKFQESIVKEGDTVLFGKTSGYEVKVGDEKLLMMPEGEIYATIKERV